jgi:hypothetical protein
MSGILLMTLLSGVSGICFTMLARAARQAQNGLQPWDLAPNSHELAYVCLGSNTITAWKLYLACSELEHSANTKLVASITDSQLDSVSAETNENSERPEPRISLHRILRTILKSSTPRSINTKTLDRALVNF